MKKMNKKGFTIVELVIVIAVIAILSAVLIPTFSGVVANAKDQAAKADAKAAYQQYVAAATLANETVKTDLVYVYGTGTDVKYVAITAGQVSATFLTSYNAEEYEAVKVKNEAVAGLFVKKAPTT